MAYGLIFDMDGVIADTETLVARATIEMYRDLYGTEITDADLRPYIGTGAVNYTKGPAEDKGIEINLDEAISARFDNFLRLMGEAGDIAYPGARELIDAALSHPDWKIAIATSTSRDKAAATLKAAGVDPSRFDAWITGDMIRRPKPNAEIYVTAALSMRMPPTRCVGIEDSVNGVESVKNACMRCVAVTNTFSAEDLSKADVIVRSLTEVNLEGLRELVEAGRGQRITWGARVKA